MCELMFLFTESKIIREKWMEQQEMEQHMIIYMEAGLWIRELFYVVLILYSIFQVLS